MEYKLVLGEMEQTKHGDVLLKKTEVLDVDDMT